MFDYNNHLSNEIRHLNFQKSLKQGVWQDVIRQQQANEIAKQQIKTNRLSNFISAVMLQLSLSMQHFLSSGEDHKQANRDLTILRKDTPENHSTG